MDFFPYSRVYPGYYALDISWIVSLIVPVSILKEGQAYKQVRINLIYL